ncbi:MAG: TIGR03546 family protein [Spirochaetaceae bacterium]|nr:MAG: TIGR03546 family protein [Spirochaetaceae bacterium]
MLVKWIATLIVAINANNRAGEVAAGVAFALLLALIPTGNLLWFVLFVVTFLLKINLAGELLFLALFKLLTPLADVLLHRLGALVLTLPLLSDVFTAAYNLPLLPLSRFNNTVVMGGLIAGLVLWIPVFLLFRWLVMLYRRTLRERIAGSRLVKALGRVPLVATIGNAVRKIGGTAMSLR